MNVEDPLASPSPATATATTTTTTTTTTVVRDSSKQLRSDKLVDTESTELQETTELECQPFFVDLKKLRKHSKDHLRETGLLPRITTNTTDAGDVGGGGGTSSSNKNNSNEEEEEVIIVEEDKYDLEICLIRDRHYDYLSKVFLPSKQPLSKNLVALDSSRPWMLYWTLHGCDLLMVPSQPQPQPQAQAQAQDVHNNNNSTMMEGATPPSTPQQPEVVVVEEVESPQSTTTSLLHEKVGDTALCSVVTTIEACWQSLETIKLPQHIRLTENDRSLLTIIEANNNNHTSDDESDDSYYYQGGGFGGGSGQMAHAATTYAAVLALCIVATTTTSSSSSSDGTSSSSSSSASSMAWSLLERKRKQLYAWFLSLQQPNGGFRMHHDGEIDVRASYTIFCIAKLLNLLTPTLASDITINYIASCQTYEGGFGGEPFSEAHGGYAYCAVAALQLANKLPRQQHDDDEEEKNVGDNSIDHQALLGWLTRRQMGYEGGFSGRANKLVDGCYSFWQGGALSIVSSHYNNTSSSSSSSSSWSHGGRGDIWLESVGGRGGAVQQQQEDDNGDTTTTTMNAQHHHHHPSSYALLFDKPMLQRYILLCAQDVNGGLRDKPSKPRDFYHSCYNLSGLSLSQHSGGGGGYTAAAAAGENAENSYNQHQQQSYGHPVHSLVAASHPCYNIRLERVSMVLDHFKD